MPIQLDEFPNLLFSKEAIDFLVENQTDDAMRKMYETLGFVNAFGTNLDYLSGHLDTIKHEPYKGFRELKGKASSNREWRFLFKKISKGKTPANYGIMIGFFKTTRKLTNKDLAKAQRIAKREGW